MKQVGILLLFFIIMGNAFSQGNNRSQAINEITSTPGNNISLNPEAGQAVDLAYLLGGFALYLNGSKEFQESPTTSAQLGYLSDTTGLIQAQLDLKANDSEVVKLIGDQSIDGVKSFIGQYVAVSTTNGSRPCPVMTEVQRDAIASPAEGDCAVNSDTSQLNYYLAAAWGPLAGGGGGVNKWLTATDYEIDNIVFDGTDFYKALTIHTSTVLATDVANGDMVKMVDPSDFLINITSDVQTQIDSKEDTLPLTTKGDLLGDNGSGLARCAASGVDGYLLTEDSSEACGFSFQDSPVSPIDVKFLARDASGQSIPNDTTTIITWATIAKSTGITYSAGGFTVITDSDYSIGSTVNYQSDSWAAGQVLFLSIYVDGSEYMRGPEYEMTSSGNYIVASSVDGIIPLTNGQTFSIRAVQKRGGATVLSTILNRNHISVGRQLP